MGYLFTQILPSLQTLRLLGNVTDFRKWLKNQYDIENSSQIFEGYLFAVRCCLNSFLDGISNDYQLKIKNDLLLERAIHEMIPLHKIANSCEKTVLLKRINPFVKKIIRAKDFSELEKEIKEFQRVVMIIFARINKKLVITKPKTSTKKSIAEKITLINFAHTYLIQINNNGPVGNFFNPMNATWEKENRKNYYLEGYKYALQYLWLRLLGSKRFNKSSLIRLHLVDSWREYKYNEENPPDNSIFFEREFDLEKQNNLDSYFWRIKQEIIDKLDAKYKLPVYEIESLLKFESRKYKKSFYFSKMLNAEGLEDPFPHLSPEDKILNRLYWYPIEVVNARESAIHFGIPSFNTMLAGTVSLHNEEVSNFKKIVIVKFIHPSSNDNNKNNYSYGILIDTQSAAGHYNSGWVIYQNACGDYSGFSGSEYKATEALIAKYKRARKIEIRVLVISLKNFQEFTDRYTKKQEQVSILDQNKLIPLIIQASRSYCFELFTYSLHVIFYKKRFSVISINTGKKSEGGEKDIILENDNEIKLIECKLNPNNQNWEEVIEKVRRKLADYPQKDKSYELWFWYEPSTQNEMILKERNIQWVSVSKTRGEPILKNVDLTQLKYIMQEYDILQFSKE
ncbi:hypothetical protein A4D02_06560 [Niastella koreensis]|uniref:Uncharacterized protein n=2 Tax=Niastella koreensis TaxID=354356 RepID=G8TG58_NIAKG|nr:hypothetical protein [Niastella koreensis]AEW01661.1 hypothetical protein Niako_5425 [Niastella koreensis GR20-10]OQP48372.1 hypothetical protein A4D02_06560 [Niastella koreensis]